MFYFQNLIFQRILKVKKTKKDGGKRGENAYLRHLTYEGAKKNMMKLLMKLLNVWILS